MEQHTIEIPACPPYSLAATVLSHGGHECSPFSWSAGGQCFQWISRVGREAVRVSVRQSEAGGIQEPMLEATIEASAIDDALVDSIRDALVHMLALDDDPAEFYGVCEDHPTLPVLAKLGAGRMLRWQTLSETLVKAVCGTNVTWKQAVKSIQRIGQLGPSFTHFASLHAWPTPAEIIKAGEDYLNDVCRLGYRTAQILRLCEQVRARDFDEATYLDDIATADPADLRKRLTAFPGIGPTSAKYLRILYGRYDELAIDSAVVAQVAKIHTKGRRPTIKQIERLYERFGPWRARVYWFEQWLTWETAVQLQRGLPT
jgi:3-methyladenine DNA glycosylase/8-oxoguanine DNA glycosylase